MAIYPHGTYRPLTVANNDPPIIVIGAILHVAASTSKSLYGYFNGPSNGIESHFFTRWDGHTEQYRDTGHEADANLKANSFIGADGRRYGYISIETQGLEPDTWTEAQITELKRLLAWLSATHDFPLERCPEHMKPGVGYHVMFGAPGPWTPVAKSCPGPKRILQFNNTLIPWMNTQNGGAGGVTGTPPEEEFTVAEADRVIEFIKAELKSGSFYDRYAQEINENRAQTGILKTAVDSVLADNKVTRDLVAALAAAEADRYADLAGRVQTGNDEERGRYGDYVARFNSILAAVKAHDERVTEVVDTPKA